MSTKTKLKWLAVTALLGLLCACGQPMATGQADLLDAAFIDAKEPNYSLVSPERTPLVQTYGATGRLIFPVEKVLSAQEETRLVQVYVGNYATVHVGDLLAELAYDQTTVQAEIALLELKRAEEAENLRLLSSQYDYNASQMTIKMQMQQEAHQRAIEKTRLDKLKADFAQTTLRHQQALANLEEQLAEWNQKRQPLQLFADVNGYARQVTSRKVGDVIAPGETILQLIDYSEYRVEFTADRGDFYYHMPVTVRLPKIDEVPGIIVTDPAVAFWAEQALTFQVELDVELPEESLYTLSSVELQIRTEIPLSQEVLILPLSAVGMENALRYVHVLEDNVVRKRYVKTGFTTTSHVQVLYGLEETDKVFKHV